MESMPDHVLLSIFGSSLVQDRMLSLQFVCNRWRNLCLYNLAKDCGPVLDTGMFEGMSLVGLRNRNDKEGRLVEMADFLSNLLHFVFELSEEDCFQCIRFSVSRKGSKFTEWFIDEDLLDLIHSRCPSLDTLDFDNAQVEEEALPKLQLFNNLKHLVIKRVGANFSPVLEALQLESLTISGKEAPLSNQSFGGLLELVVESPSPSSYSDLLCALTTSAPVVERVIRKRGVDREQLPVDALGQIRSHPALKTFSDGAYYLNDDAALSQLVDTKQGQFERLLVYSEDCLRLSPLCQLEKLRSVAIDGKNLEPAELASVFLLPNLERVSLSWTFKDDRDCLLESQSQFAQQMMDIRCGNLKYAYLHLDYMSVNGRAWGKNVIVNVLQQCPRMKRLTTSDWLLAQDYVELRRAERFVDVARKIDININSALDLFSMLHELSERDELVAADPFRWSRLTHLNVFINEDYYVCDLGCVNGDTLPNLTTFKIRSDDEVFFERFCDLSTLDRLTRIEGVVRFENADAEADWLDQLGEHQRLVWLSTIQTNLTASLFCDVLMRARARMAEAGRLPPATVLYVGQAPSRRIRPMESDRKQWADVTKILATSRIALRVLCT